MIPAKLDLQSCCKFNLKPSDVEKMESTVNHDQIPQHQNIPICLNYDLFDSFDFL